MLDRELVITIPGDPAPKGSLKCIGRRGRVAHNLVEDNEKSTPWREKIVWLLKSKRGRWTPAAHHQPIAAEVTFTLARPPSQYGQGRNSKRVLPSAPAYPTAKGTGDVDKLLRLVLDALEDAGVLDNDAQIIEVTTRKEYVLAEVIDPSHPVAGDVLPYPGVRIRLYPA